MNQPREVAFEVGGRFVTSVFAVKQAPWPQTGLLQTTQMAFYKKRRFCRRLPGSIAALSVVEPLDGTITNIGAIVGIIPTNMLKGRVGTFLGL